MVVQMVGGVSRRVNIGCDRLVSGDCFAHLFSHLSKLNDELLFTFHKSQARILPTALTHVLTCIIPLKTSCALLLLPMRVEAIIIIFSAFSNYIKINRET